MPLAAVVLLLGLVFCARILLYTLGRRSGCLRCLLCDATPNLLRAVSLEGIEFFADGLNPLVEIEVFNHAAGNELGLVH